MKRFLLSIVIFLLLSHAAQAAQTYTFDRAHTDVDWHVRLFGISSATGIFKIRHGVLTIDNETPANNRVSVTIDADSLSTGNPSVDKLLKGKSFLQTDKYPRASFKSTKVRLAKSGKTAKVTGLLTLHGVTRPVTLDVTLEKRGQGMLVFKTTTTIKRSAFGVLKYKAIASDDVNLTIEAEARLNK